MYKKIYDGIDKVRSLLLVVISSFTVLLCLLQVILRYFTFISLRPFPWGDEVLRLSAVWVIFLGISMGIKHNSHFSVNFFREKIKSDKTKNIIDLVELVFCFLFFILIAVLGFQYALSNTTSLLQNLDMSMSFFYMSIPVGSILCAFEILNKIYLVLKKENSSC